MLDSDSVLWLFIILSPLSLLVVLFLWTMVKEQRKYEIEANEWMERMRKRNA